MCRATGAGLVKKAAALARRDCTVRPRAPGVATGRFGGSSGRAGPGAPAPDKVFWSLPEEARTFETRRMPRQGDSEEGEDGKRWVGEKTRT